MQITPSDQGQVQLLEEISRIVATLVPHHPTHDLALEAAISLLRGRLRSGGPHTCTYFAMQ